MQPLRQLMIMGATLSSACTQTLTQALARLPSIQPDPPITVEDTVTAAALLATLATGYVRGPQVIIANVNGEVTSASLPRADTLTFLFLTPDHIQQLADEYGDLDYVRISRPTVRDSVATVIIGIFGAFSRTLPTSAVIDGPSSCEWHLARGIGQWRVQGTGRCLVS